MLQEKAYRVIGFDDTHTTALEGGIGEWSRRGRGAMSEGNGKPKRTALPFSLITPISPCIRVTNCLQMANPNPVPPNFLVVELSAWVNDSKSVC